MVIKQFFARNNARTDSGYQAFETLGRRVGGQYDQAGNDIRDIGRAKADVINMVGRWPFNILELQKRTTAATAPAAAPRGGYNVRVAGGGSSITDAQFAPRVMPNLAALNEMSEGAAYLGRALGGGGGPSTLPSARERRRREDDRFEREQARKQAAANAAWQKRRDLYDKGLSKYNEDLMKETQDWYNKSGGVGREYGNDMSGPSSTYDSSGNQPWESDYAPPEETEYSGGGAGWLYRNTIGLVGDY